MVKSNLQIKSNLMIDDGQKRTKYFLGYLFRDLGYKDSRSFEQLRLNVGLTQQQLYEYEMTIHCITCGRPCAGTYQRPK